MEPRTFTEKDLSPDGPGGCIWEGEEEMDCAFLFMFFNVCLYIGGGGEPFGVSGSQVCGKDVYGRKCHSGPQTGDRPLMGTKGGAVLLLRVPAKLSLTLQLRLSSLCSLVLSESPDLGRGLPRSTWPMAEPE